MKSATAVVSEILHFEGST